MTKTNQEIIQKLQMDETEFIGSIIDQLKDNAYDIQKLTEDANDPNSRVTDGYVVRELIRLSGRTESLLNLASRLLDAADETLAESIQDLMDQEKSLTAEQVG